MPSEIQKQNGLRVLLHHFLSVVPPDSTFHKIKFPTLLKYLQLGSLLIKLLITVDLKLNILNLFITDTTYTDPI